MGQAARSGPDLHGELVLEAGALVLDKYRLVEQRGSGSMGTVWSATHVTLGSGVAIKLLAGNARGSADSRQRFEREARLAARLGEESPHIARVIDYGMFGTTPCLVMELLHGEELSVRLKRVGRMSLSSTALIVHQLCRALSVAHAAGVVHRDIKPSNVFLCPLGGTDRLLVKLMDFGIAKATRGVIEEGDEETTRAGMVVGTPAYMSPEQVLAQQAIDARADLWSLGAMIYRMVVGLAPFGQGGFGEIGVRILAVEPTAPSVVFPKLPKSFDDFMRKALAKDPSQRFQSTDELSAALALVAAVRPNELDTTTMRALKTATTLSPVQPAPDSLAAIPLTPKPAPRPVIAPPSSRGGSGVRRVHRRAQPGLWIGLGFALVTILVAFGHASRTHALASSTHLHLSLVPVVVLGPAPVASAVIAAAPLASTSASASSTTRTRQPQATKP